MASATDKEGKRSRLGNRVQRGVYRSAHGYKHPWWGALSLKAMQLNRMVSVPTKQESSLDVKEQARVFAQQKADDVAARARYESEGVSALNRPGEK